MAVLPRSAVVANPFFLETDLSQVTECANTALAALRILSFWSGNFWINVRKIGVPAMAAYLLSGKSILSLSSAAIFFSGSAIFMASLYAF